MIGLFDNTVELDNTTIQTKTPTHILHPITCEGSFAINGAWVLTIELLKDDIAPALVQYGNRIVVDMPNYARQLFAISSISSDPDTLTIEAVPELVWQLSHNYLVLDARPTQQTGENALRWLFDKANAPFEVISDIQRVSSAEYIRKNLQECINGDGENSFVNRWGGELIYDNYTLIANHSAGKDKGVAVRTGFNVSSWSISEDMSEYCDSIIPYTTYGDKTVVGEEIQREGIGRIQYKKFIEYANIKSEAEVSDDELEEIRSQNPTNKVSLYLPYVAKTEQQAKEALEELAEMDFEANNYLPLYTYDIDFVDLTTSKQYEDYKDLLGIWLGDTVTVTNMDRCVATKQKVVSIEYDFITKEITNMTLGNIESNYFVASEGILQKAEKTIETVNSITNADTREILAQKVAGSILASKAQLKAQYDAINSKDSIAVICENRDTESPLFGCLAYGTQGLMLSKHLSESGEWVFSTAITSTGIIADYIVTGILTDKTGNFFLDLDSGEFVLGAGTFRGTIDTKEDIVVGRNIGFGGGTEINDGDGTLYLMDKDGNVTETNIHAIKSRGAEGYLGSLYLTGYSNANITIAGCDGRIIAQQIDGRIKTWNSRIQLGAERVGVSGDLVLGGDVIVEGTTGVTYSGSVSRLTIKNGIIVGYTA